MITGLAFIEQYLLRHAAEILERRLQTVAPDRESSCSVNRTNVARE